MKLKEKTAKIRIIKGLHILSIIICLGLGLIGSNAEATKGKLNMKISKNDTTNMNIENIEIALYKIATSSEEAPIDWEVFTEYEESGILNAKTARELETVCRTLETMTEGKTAYRIIVTNETGIAEVDGLANGIYFGKLKSGPKGLEIKPFAVTIPTMEYNEFVYEIGTTIKYQYTEPTKKPETHQTPTPTIEPEKTPTPKPTQKPTATPTKTQAEEAIITVSPTKKTGATTNTTNETPTKEITAAPAPEPVTITVNYYVEDDLESQLKYKKEYGDAFHIITPPKEGYTWDIAEIKGTATENKEYDVHYIRKQYMLTIHYIYEDGSVVAQDHREKHYTGEKYDVSSPGITGYICTKPVNKGEMKNDDIDITVIYIKTNGAKLYTIEDYNVALGLGDINMNVGISID